MKKVFIDGKAGTTGLRIYERLNERQDIEIITLSEEERKLPEARRRALNACDIAFLCLPDDAARESAALFSQICQDKPYLTENSDKKQKILDGIKFII